MTHPNKAFNAKIPALEIEEQAAPMAGISGQSMECVLIQILEIVLCWFSLV